MNIEKKYSAFEKTYFRPEQGGKLSIQLCRLEMAPLLKKYYRNEVTLTGQNPPSKFC